MFASCVVNTDKDAQNIHKVGSNDPKKGLSRLLTSVLIFDCILSNAIYFWEDHHCMSIYVEHYKPQYI